MLRRPLFVTCLVAAVPALAQQRADIVVTGRGLDARPGDKAAPTVVIDTDRLATNAANRLEAVLADVAGLQQFRRSDARSANPTSQGLTLRGIGGNASSRALLILDGVPQADPFGGWVAFPAYATGRLGQIRVTRGGGSGYYGAGALAGTIELESAMPGVGDPLSAQIAYGSRDSIDAQGSAALRRAGGFAIVSAAYARGDGFVPVVAEQRGAADRPARYEQASGAVRGVIAPAADTELQASLSAFTDRRDRGTAFTDSRSEGADASLRIVHRGAWEAIALAYVQTRSFASRFASIDAARTTATQTLDQYNTPATGIGGRLEVAPSLGPGRELRIGVDTRAVSGRTQELYTFVAGAPTRRRVAGGATRTSGIFADASLQQGAWTLTLGGRIDRWRISDGRVEERALAGGAAITDSAFTNRSGIEATGRAGIAWSPVAPLTVRAAAYRGWRLPTLNELYRPFRVGADATAANTALAPERLTGIDGGVTLTPAAGVSLGATWFWNRLSGAIANVTAGRGPGQFPGVGFVGAGGIYRIRQNLDAIRSTGLELDARAARGPLFAIASWSHADPRVIARGAAAGLDGLRPAQTPRDFVSATLGWRRDAAIFSATLRHSARQFEDDQNSRTLAPATTLDAYVGLPLTKALTIGLRGENVLDQRVEAAIAGAGVIERATPRTLWIELRLRGG